MSSFDKTTWERLRLVKELIEKQDGKETWYDITEVAKHLAPILSWRPLGLEEFTDHDLEHSYRIIRAIGAVLPENIDLNKNELTILIYSAIFHDLGMWTKKREVENSLSNDQFVNFFESSDPQSYKKIISLTDSLNKQDRYVGYLYLRPFVAMWSRMTHATRSAEILKGELSDVEGIIPQRIKKDLIAPIATLCASHSWSTEMVLTSDELDRCQVALTSDYDEDWVNLRFLSFLLRLGDLLDLDSHRISSLVWLYLGDLSPEAEAHWRMHSSLRFKSLNPDLIQVIGQFNYDRYGEIAAEALNLAQKWCSYISKEVDGLRRISISSDKYGVDKRVKVGQLMCDFSNITGEGIIFAEDLTFSMDKQRVIEILGDEIYSDKSAFVRELIQNSLDATRTQVVKDVISKPEFVGIRDGLDLRSPNSWSDEIVGRDDYTIDINTGYEEVEGQDKKEFLLTFEILDRGIGMTANQIKDYFLQVGQSYYKSKEFLATFKHSPISRFGIGFLSCLLVSKRIEVETKTHEVNAVGLKLVIESKSDTIGIFRASDVMAGTRVKLWFSQEIVQDDNWISNQHKHNDVLKMIFPEGTTQDKLVEAIYYWCPWSEIDFRINGTLRRRRTPLQIRSTTNYWSFPFELRAAEDRELLGVGSVLRKKENIVITTPHMENDISDIQFVSSGGGVAVPPWNPSDEMSIVFDLLRMPTSFLSASRHSKFDIPSAETRAEILMRWGDEVEKIYKSQEAWRSLWRSSIIWKEFDLPLLLPVIRDGDQLWEEWDSRRFKTEHCILVPFFAPLKFMKMRNRLPIVGVPRRATNTPREAIPTIDTVQAVRIHEEFTGATLAHIERDKVISSGYTYILHSLARYNRSSAKWEKVRSELSETDEIRATMQDHDKHFGNAWIKYGFDPSRKESWELAYTLLGTPRVDETFPVFTATIPRHKWNAITNVRDIMGFRMMFKMFKVFSGTNDD